MLPFIFNNTATQVISQKNTGGRCGKSISLLTITINLLLNKSQPVRLTARILSSIKNY